jgi:hypothetical protein
MRRFMELSFSLAFSLALIAGCGSNSAESSSPFADWSPGPWGVCQSGCGSAEPVQLAAGDFHTCARMADGSVRCWGDNSRGQLLGSTRLDPIVGLTGIVDIAAGGLHTCALRKDGATFCWGQNTSGQLGALGDVQPHPELVPVDASFFKGQKPARLVAQGNQSCAILADTTIGCWGSYDGGLPAAFGSGLVEISLVAGSNVNCIRYSSGGVRIYVANIGNSSDMEALSNAVEIAGNARACLSVFPDGTMRGWALHGPTGNHGGPNSWDGNLPLLAGTPTCPNDYFDGSCVPSSLPLPAPAWAQNVKHVALTRSGPGFGCLVYKDGTVGCWGHTDTGQLGNGVVSGMNGAYLFAPQMTPVPVAGLRNIEQLAIGARHTCALDSSHRVFCFGQSYPTYPSSKLGSADQVDGAPPSSPLVFTP